MQETKAFWKSRGFLGPLVAILAMILDGAGFGGIDQGQLVDWLLNGFEIGGAILGIIGRARATTRLGLRDALAPAAPSSETGARLQAAWPATLAAVFLALVLAGCVSSTVVPQTQVQRFYAAEADYKSLIKIAVAYKRDCVAKPADLQFGCGDVVAEIQRIDAEILFPLIVTGRAAVASGDDLRIAAARHAVTKGLNELRRYLISQGLTQSGAVLLPADPGPGPPGAHPLRARYRIDWRMAA